MINWLPIAELPDELKDGREVLLWDEYSGWGCLGRRFGDDEPWRDGTLEVDPTHFAEFNKGPDWEFCQHDEVVPSDSLDA